MNKCDGCSKELEHVDSHPDYCRSPDGVRVELAPDAKVVVCATSRYPNMTFHSVEATVNPRLPCIRKAWEKAHVCPGCGECNHHNPFEGLCNDCADALARAKETLGDRPAAYCLDTSLVSSVYLGRDDKEDVIGTLLDGLTRIASARGPRSRGKDVGWGKTLTGDGKHHKAHTGMLRIELDNDQREALEQVTGQIRALVDTSYLCGRKAGRDLLGNLADGTYSIAEFSDQHARHTKEEDE